MDKLQIIGIFSYDEGTRDLQAYQELSKGADFGTGATLLDFEKRIADHFAPQLPDGAVWKNRIRQLGKLKIIVEKMDDVS